MARTAYPGIILTIALSLLGSTAQAQPDSCYRITHIGPERGDDAFFVADMNDKAELVGGRALRAFLWRKGQFVNLPAPLDHAQSAALAINDRSDIAGTYDDAQSQSHAVLLKNGTAAIEIHATPGETEVIPVEINNRRQVLGQSWNSATGWDSFIWYRGQARLLERLPNDTTRLAAGINDRDQAVGASGPTGFAVAVMWDGNTVMPVPKPGGAEAALGVDINNHGQVLANAFFVTTFPRTERPYTWTDGDVAVLDVLYPDQNNAAASDMNNRGRIVGTTFNSRTGTAIATLWRNGHPFDLNSLLCSDDPLAQHLHLSEAQLINDRNAIVAIGIDERDPDVAAYFLLLPGRRAQ